MKVVIRNLTQDVILGDSIELAHTSSARRTGLLNKESLQPGEGLWIMPCEAVHTFFMKFSIDVLYIDRKKKIRKAVRALVPWRLSGCLTAHSTLELPAGTIESTGTRTGDLLEVSKL